MSKASNRARTALARRQKPISWPYRGKRFVDPRKDRETAWEWIERFDSDYRQQKRGEPFNLKL
jgi:hypothetical protein